MNEAIIFGASSFGKKVYMELKSEFLIKYFCDNDMGKWGNELFGIKIISPEILNTIDKDIQIIIASSFYNEIIEQLEEMRMTNIWYISNKNSFMRKYEPNVLKFNDYSYFGNKVFEVKSILSNKVNKVLFIQNKQDIRTYKLAQVLMSNDIQVDIAYLDTHPSLLYKGLELPYKNIIKIDTSLNGFISYLNDSDYDIIHSSNEPDYLTTLILKSNKPVVHDIHDLMSLRGDLTNGDIIHEYIANKYSDGNIYIDNPIKNYAIDLFDIRDKPILLLNNYLLRNQLPKSYYKKLSYYDGEIHCVYEGGLVRDSQNHRFLEEKFIMLARQNIHVHFYTNREDLYYHELSEKHDYLHWEGIVSPNDLISELTKYDIGLVFLNVNVRNKMFLSSTFPNKIFEYLGAKLPIVVEDLPVLRKFVNETKTGKCIDFNRDILSQMKLVKDITITDRLLDEYNFFMESHFYRLIEFYNLVHNNYHNNASNRAR